VSDYELDQSLTDAAWLLKDARLHRAVALDQLERHGRRVATYDQEVGAETLHRCVIGTERPCVVDGIDCVRLAMRMEQRIDEVESPVPGASAIDAVDDRDPALRTHRFAKASLALNKPGHSGASDQHDLAAPAEECGEILGRNATHRDVVGLDMRDDPSAAGVEIRSEHRQTRSVRALDGGYDRKRVDGSDHDGIDALLQKAVDLGALRRGVEIGVGDHQLITRATRSVAQPRLELLIERVGTARQRDPDPLTTTAAQPASPPLVVATRAGQRENQERDAERRTVTAKRRSQAHDRGSDVRGGVTPLRARGRRSKSRAKSIDRGPEAAHFLVPPPTVWSMPLRKELLEEMGRAREAAELESQRGRRRELLRASALCIAWMLLGLYLLAWSMHTTSFEYGHVAFYSGVIVGNAGIIFTLLNTYRRLEKRGDL
jgi:hypothetical protein